MYSIRGLCRGKPTLVRILKTPLNTSLQHTLLCLCSRQQRWSSQLLKSTSGKEDETLAISEWDRSIKDAIEQAKRELGAQNKPDTGKETDEPTDHKQQDDPQQSNKPEKNDSKKDKDNEQKTDYITTLGRVMQELPHEIEGFLEHGLDAPIYSENIRFTEPRHSGIQLNGRTAYQGMARALRLAMNAYFSQPTITILSMRQVPVSEQRSEGDSDMAMAEAKHYEVMVRWVFEGVPRHMELIGRGDEGSRYEGEFRYALDPETALVAVHEVTAIHPAPPTAIFGSASPLARWAGWLSPRGSLSLARNTDTAGNKRSRMRRHQPWWFE